MAHWIAGERTIIPACDVDLATFRRLIAATADLPAVGAYKISAALALTIGLPTVVREVRSLTSKPLIYDHQKAGTDIPDTADSFCAAVADSGIDALILFPMSGPASETAWIRSALARGLKVLVGGHMTHERYLESEGGYVSDAAVERMFRLAAHEGVTDYVVPGNKPDVIRSLRKLLVGLSIDPIFYAPGFIAQSGDIASAAQAAGSRWHAIVGRALYGAVDILQAVRSLSRAL